MRHGGQILIDQLAIQGCDTVFCVPGESYLAALDALHDSMQIRTITCRQEGGAAMMAEAYGKVRGKPGVCFVTRAPGATNASSGLHIAQQDSTPMILFIGQVGRDMVDREAFQEVDYRRMFGQLSKWVAQIDDIARIPEYVSRAYHIALSGRPGPVVLALPEDMLSATIDISDARPASAVEAKATDQDIEAALTILEQVSRPLVVAGGGGWTREASGRLAEFAVRLNLPICAAFRRQDCLDNRHPNYVGDAGIGINPKLANRIRESDLILCLGARLGEMTTSGYTLLDIPNPRQRFIHVYPAPDELGRVYRPELAINASPRSFLDRATQFETTAGKRWSEWTGGARADYLANIEPQETPGNLKLERIIVWLRDSLPQDAILTNGAGNYSAWVHRYYQYGPPRTQVAPTCGSMGYGLPAAIAAKHCEPGKTVVCFAGDGCFLMTGQELATAVQYQLPIIVLVVNNNMYGTIRMHQERHYPGRPIATALRNPNFAEYARSFGAFGEVVTRTDDFPTAFDRALKSGMPALLELRTDAEAISPRFSLRELSQSR